MQKVVSRSRNTSGRTVHFVLDKDWEYRVKLGLNDGKSAAAILSEINKYIKEENGMRTIHYELVSMPVLERFIAEITTPKTKPHFWMRVLQVQSSAGAISLPFSVSLLRKEDEEEAKAREHHQGFHRKYSFAVI